MSESKIYSFIGLAKKAGAVIAGVPLTEKAVKQGKAHLVLVAKDASGNTGKKVETVLYGTDVPLKVFGDKESLGQILGKPFVSVITVTDMNFSKRIQEMIEEEKILNTAYGGGVFE
ncbi:MAG: 50S ribosomal protein L7ae [Clostridiaceae bacterium]|nr:50S ribosomal protein L7ae [Clostridiaceae bacterium]